MTEQIEVDISAFCPKGDVMVIAEHILGELQPVTLELLGAGRILADKMERNLKCLVMGYNLGDIPQKLVEYGADEVYVADHVELEKYRTLPYRRVVCDFLESLPEPPHTCLLGSTTTGRDLAPRIAAHFDTGLTADCTELDIGPYEHKSKVDSDQNRSISKLSLCHPPQLWRKSQSAHPRSLEKSSDGYYQTGRDDSAQARCSSQRQN